MGGRGFYFWDCYYASCYKGVSKLKLLPKFTKLKVSKAGYLSRDDLSKLGRNLLLFTAPALAALFGQLALGVEPKAASLFALVILFGILADYFRKLNSSN